MNYLDELLALYSAGDVNARKFLLTAMGNLPIRFDTVDVVGLLWEEAVSPEIRLRHQARRELGRVMPRYVEHHYGYGLRNAGVWSQYQVRAQDPVATTVGDESAGPRSVIDAAAMAGLEIVWPAVKLALDQMATRSIHVKQAGSLLAGRTRTHSVAARLSRRVADGDTSFDLFAPLAELDAPDSQELLMATARAQAMACPEFAGVISTAGGEPVFRLLEAVATRSDEEGRISVAQALWGDRSTKGRELLRWLIDRKENWVTIHALSAIQASPLREDMALVKRAYTSGLPEFVQAQALKTAGYIAGNEATTFLQERLVDRSHRLQAAALEGLARLRCPPGQLHGAAIKLLESPLLRARVNAMLVLAREEPDRVGLGITQLFTSDQAMHRLEGAYLLGYLIGPGSAAALHEIATRDPVEQVRMQAVKSMARQPWKVAVERLGTLGQGEDPAIATTAARALAAVPFRALAAAQDQLLRLLAATSLISVKAEILRAIGITSTRRGEATMPLVFLESLQSPETVVVQGGLEAIKVSGGFGQTRTPDPLLSHADPWIRANAAVASFWSGADDGVPILSDLVRSENEETQLAGYGALLEIVVMLPVVLRSDRFSMLARLLGARAREASPGSFVQRETLPVRSPAHDAPAEVTDRDDEVAPDSGSIAMLAVELGSLGEAPAALRQNYARDVRPKAAPPPASPVARTAVRPGGRLPAPAPLAREGLAQVSYMADASTGWRGALGDRLPQLRLATILILCLLPLGAAVTRCVMLAGSESSHIAGRHVRMQLTVTALAGVAHRTSLSEGTVPIALGQHLGSGLLIATEAGAQVTLADKTANEVQLSGSSRVLLGLSPTALVTDPAPIAFSLPQGDVTFDMSHASVADICFTTASVRVVRGKVQVHTTGAGETVTAIHGDVVLRVPGSADAPIAADQHMTLGNR